MQKQKLFYTPLTNVIVKADKNDPYTIYLEASNERADEDKEIVFTKALEDEVENYLRKGVLSWDHLHKSTGDPGFIVGEPLDVKFKDGSTFVKGKLYRTVDKAQKIAALLEGGCTKLGASIGGFIKETLKLGKALKGVTKIIWDEVAITYKPVNEPTRGNVSLVPIGAFSKALRVSGCLSELRSKAPEVAETLSGAIEDIFNEKRNDELLIFMNKALTAGAGAGFAAVGGRAMIPESLQGSVVKVDDLMKEFVWRMKHGDIKTDEDFKDFLEYQNAPFLYGKLKQIIVNKYH